MRLICLLVLLALAGHGIAADVETPPASARVVRVYDGDTYTLENGERVRLKGVNTTELRPKEPFGEEAREAAKAFLLGRMVELRYGSVVRDGYGRLVADVLVDGKSLETHLVRLGLGHVFLLPPIEGDVAPLLEAQAAARGERIGIWSDPHFRGPFHITSFHANGRGDEREDPNAEYARICNITDTPQNLSGYRVTNARGRSFRLPEVVIPPGHTFELRSGAGEHQVDPERQIRIHLGSRVPVWNNKVDRLTLLDPRGQIVDVRDHKVASQR
ncbi:MAG: thermonuclease family protein [Deltaproteobacteria bacterium]|nr:thermonuclease family protein [Deltaproteobacteria bacterium]